MLSLNRLRLRMLSDRDNRFDISIRAKVLKHIIIQNTKQENISITF